MFPDLAQLLMQLGMSGAGSGMLPTAGAGDLGGMMNMGRAPGDGSIPAAPPMPVQAPSPELRGMPGIGGDAAREASLYPLLQQAAGGNPAAVPGMVDPAASGFGGGPTTGSISPAASPAAQAASKDAQARAALARLAQVKAPDAPKPPQPGVPGGNKPPEQKMQVNAQAPAIQALL